MAAIPIPGSRFVPTDQELLRHYLRPKVRMRNLPHLNVIPDRDLYKEEEPLEIFQGKSVSEMYFFTPIKKKYQNGKNIDRVITGKGAWKTQGTKKVFCEKRLIGFKTTLNFVSNNKNSKSSSWIMHEYTLNKDEQKWALCRIKRGRGNTTGSGGASRSVGGVSMSGDKLDEEEEDNKLAAAAAPSNLEKEGELHPVEVHQLSDETDSTSDEASDSDDDKQLEVIASIPKDKGKVAVDYSEPNHVGSLNVAAPPDDLMKVIADSYDRIQLAVSSKHYSVKEECENLQGRNAELESQLAKMKKELNVAILQMDSEKNFLLEDLRNKEANYQRSLEGIQADYEQKIDNLKDLLCKAEAENKRDFEEPWDMSIFDTCLDLPSFDDDSCCE